MKVLILKTLSLSAFLCLAGFAAAQKTVMDMRYEYDPVAIPDAEQQRVLAQVRAYGKLPVCEGGEVFDKTPGAFTRKGARQTAYLVMNCAPMSMDPSSTEFGRLAVYENGKIVLLLKNIGNAIGNVGDLNKDGMDDLLFLNYMGPQMGQYTANASVVTVAGGKFRTLANVTEALVDTCETSLPNPGVIAHVLTVVPGVRPAFTDTTYAGDCSDPVNFVRKGSRKF